FDLVFGISVRLEHLSNEDRCQCLDRNKRTIRKPECMPTDDGGAAFAEGFDQGGLLGDQAIDLRRLGIEKVRNPSLLRYRWGWVANPVDGALEEVRYAHPVTQEIEDLLSIGTCDEPVEKTPVQFCGRRQYRN